MENEVVADKVDQPDTTEAESAQTEEKSLDDLLDNFNSEFDQDTQPGKTETTEEVSKSDVAEMKQFMAEQRQTNTDTAVSEAAKTIKSMIGDDLPINVSEDHITDLLYGKASRDQRFLNAFVQRTQKPQEWNKILAGFANKFKDDFGKPIDQQVTQDREAVTTSIRGQSTVTEETPNLAGMTDAKFDEWKLKNG